MNKQIWVLPDINNAGGEISKTGLGLLSEANKVAEKAGGTVTAIVFGDDSPDYSGVFSQYGVSRIYLFQDPIFKRYSAEVYTAALLPYLREEKPWLLIMSNMVICPELAPQLAVLLEAGIVTDCVKIDVSQPEKPLFYRPVYDGQLYQEIVLDTDKTILATMDGQALSNTPAAKPVEIDTTVIETRLPASQIKTKHIEFLPADFQTVDVAEAKTVVSAGMGAATNELYPLVQELADLIEGAIGTTRPVVDEGIIPRERMIGQTGKTVSPDLYLALGISGATHHVGGIQESEKIISINRDPQASIFQNSDAGIVGDLREILPKLIDRIKKARSDGEIL